MTFFKRNKISQGIKFALLASMVTYLPIKSQVSEASGILTFDPTAVARIANQTSQQLENFAKQMLMEAEKLANDIMLGSQGMRNDFNRSMMEVGNITDVQTNTHNLYMMAELKPDYDSACNMLTINQYQTEQTVATESMNRTALSNYVSRNIPRAGEDPRIEETGIKTPFQFKMSMFDKMEELEDTYSGGSFAGSDADEGSVFLNPSIMFKDNLTEEEYDIAIVQQELLSGPPLPEFDIEDVEIDAYKEEYVNRSRHMIMKTFPVHVLQDIISSRFADPETELSKVGLMERYLDDTIRNEEWVKKYTNTDQDIEKLTTPAQVQRQIAMMQGKRLELEMLNYKQMEQIKGLLAVQSIMNLEQ